MTGSREEFLQRVRKAVAEGNRPGAAPALEARGTVGYQGGGTDLVSHFVTQLTKAGGTAHVVPDRAAALATIADLVTARNAQRVLLGRSPLLDSLPLRQQLTALGKEVAHVEELSAEAARVACFAADLGITGVDFLIAETGSLVVSARAEEPRSLSLLPPVHIAVAEARQILPDLFDAFPPDRPMPSCLVLITGPSKTGDIELRLVTGVHGPGEVHVVLVKGLP